MFVQLIGVESEPEKIHERPREGTDDPAEIHAVLICVRRLCGFSPASATSNSELMGHPPSIAFVIKLNSLCRMSLDREMAALSAIDRIERGEAGAR
jgi:hypothetical protein